MRRSSAIIRKVDRYGIISEYKNMGRGDHNIKKEVKKPKKVAKKK
jgi:hypothetical protein